jgi:elongation factor P
MAIKATEIKPGQALVWEGQLNVVLETDHVKPGKGPAYVQAKMKNIDTGSIRVNRINSSDKVEDVEIVKRSMQYLFDSSGRGEGPFVFMDNATFEQIEVTADVLPREQNQWLKETLDVMLTMFEGRVLSVELPAAVELLVTEATPQVKGATATNQLKDAVVETGAKIRVPPFIENGQMVRINTMTGEYAGKA